MHPVRGRGGCWFWDSHYLAPSDRVVVRDLVLIKDLNPARGVSPDCSGQLPLSFGTVAIWMYSPGMFPGINGGFEQIAAMNLLHV